MDTDEAAFLYVLSLEAGELFVVFLMTAGILNEVVVIRVYPCLSVFIRGFICVDLGHMNETLPAIYLARHGETAWSLTGQHTGLTELPLTERGERNARRLGERLAGLTFAKVLTSPLQRAARTCELAGFRSVAEVDPDLVEWDYGKYEGLRT